MSACISSSSLLCHCRHFILAHVRGPTRSDSEALVADSDPQCGAAAALLLHPSATDFGGLACSSGASRAHSPSSCFTSWRLCLSHQLEASRLDSHLSRPLPLRSVTTPSQLYHRPSSGTRAAAAPMKGDLAPPQTISNGPGLDGLVSVGGKTMAGQDRLPHLPIPPLKDTMKRYLRALEGLQVSCSFSKSVEDG